MTEVFRLADLCTIDITDGTHQTPTYAEQGIKFLSSKNVTTGMIDWDNIMYIPESLHEELYKRITPQRDDILLAKNGTTGVAAIVDRDEVFDIYVSLALLRPNQQMVNPRYLLYAINNPSTKRFFDSHLKGIGVPNLHLTHIRETPIPVPSMEKQHEIVDILDKVSGLIAMRKKQLQKLDDLVKARFVEMFGDLETNPKGYEQRKLGSLANKISDGVHAKPEYTETGRPFISVVNINKGVIDFEECKFVSEDAYQKMIKSTHPERGDILYTKVGATYGIPAYVDTDTEFCLYVSVCLIKPKRDEIDARFLALSMSMPYIKRQADSRIKGIGVPDLHLNQIREFDVICPPRHEQEAFVTFVEQIDKSKLTIQQSLDKLELMKKALMQKYFG